MGSRGARERECRLQCVNLRMSAVTVSDGYTGTVLRSRLPYHRGQKTSQCTLSSNHSFDGSVCAPTNKLCPNDGTPTPVGCENKLVPALAGLNGGSVPAADPTPVPGVMTDARNGFAAPRPTPKPVACGCSPTPIEEPPPSVVNPLIPVLAVGELVGCLEGPKLPPRPAPVLTPVVGDDTPLRPEPRPVAPLVPIPTPVVGGVTPLRPAPRPTPAGALTPVVPVVPAGMTWQSKLCQLQASSVRTAGFEAKPLEAMRQTMTTARRP